jgi:type I restriction enzyme S subunit
VAAVSYGIQKSPANRPGKHARPYLRVANVQRGALDLREIKYIDVPDSDMPAFRLEVNDLLVCEGNSADLVGRPAIWKGEIADCVHQNHILRVRLDPKRVLPEFLLEYMQSEPARNYFRSRAKFTTNLASINSNDLRDFPFPIPPRHVQEELVSRANSERAKMAVLIGEIERITKNAKAEIETALLAERPKSD